MIRRADSAALYNPHRYIIPEGAYRCFILDCDFETATFQDVKNKRRINALKYVFAKALGQDIFAPRHFTPYQGSADDMHR